MGPDFLLTRQRLSFFPQVIEMSFTRGNTKLSDAGSLTEMAIDQVLSDPENWPRDLGGSVNTDEFGHRVCAAVGKLARASVVRF